MCRAHSEFLSACLVSAAHLMDEAKLAMDSQDLTGISNLPCHPGSIWWLGFAGVFPMCIVSHQNREKTSYFLFHSLPLFFFFLSWFWGFFCNFYDRVCINRSRIDVCAMEWSVVYPNRLDSRKVHTGTMERNEINNSVQIYTRQSQYLCTHAL